LVSSLSARDAIKLLTIGNSFANNATEFLPAMAKAAGKDLLIFRANPGGCSLERHAKAMQAFELNPADPAGRLYTRAFFPLRPEAKEKWALQEILAAEKWDFVTIQQVSNDSFRYETFEPFAKELIDCIHRLAPQAEILIHQTWAYREDYPGFANGAFTQQMMFDGLVESYRKLGEAYHLRVIPVGTAIQMARANPRWKFTFPDPNFNYLAPVAGTKPMQTGSLNVGWTVAKKVLKKAPEIDEPAEPAAGSVGTGVAVAEPPKAAETLVATLDFKHCNAEGKYLGAAVWYGFLFSEKTVALTYVPPMVKPEDAALLRTIADEVLAVK
jgi:hypothetical protein